jgi:protein gp37
MSDTTNISWTQHTWNPWEGCTRVSPGCRNCYMFTALRRMGRDPTTPRRTSTWEQPDRWNKRAEASSVPELVFTCSFSDWFHEDADQWRPEAWQVIQRCQNLRFQVLTKRPLRIADHLPPDWGNGYPNVWLGVSIEDNEHVWRADVLRKIPACVRFISAEPLLGPLPDLDLTGIHWLIVGGESGPGFRDMDRNWARQLRDQAKGAGVAFFFKQSANIRPGRGDLLDGRRWHEFPSLTAGKDYSATDANLEEQPPGHDEPIVREVEPPIEPEPIVPNDAKPQRIELECLQAEETDTATTLLTEQEARLREEHRQQLAQLQAELEQQREEIKSLRAEAERERTAAEAYRRQLKELIQQSHDDFTRAARAEKERDRYLNEMLIWQQRADSASARANFAQSIVDLLLITQKATRLLPMPDPGDLNVLGLPWPCTRGDVEKAYSRLAKQHHPDRGGNREEFEKAKQACDKVIMFMDQMGYQ